MGDFVAVILLILKIVGIVLLMLLAIVFIIVFILLLTPFKYKFYMINYDKLEIDTKFTWLFSIISVQYKLKDGQDNLIIKIPFINDNKKTKKSVNTKKEKTKPQNKKPATEIHTIISAKDTEQKTQQHKTVEHKNTCNNKVEDRLNNIKLKIKDIFKIIKNVILEIIKYKNIAKEFDMEFGIKRCIGISFVLVKDILHALKPKTLEVNGTIGFEDPADTGMALGAISMCTFYLPGKYYIDGDFEKSTVKGDIKLKGGTNLLLILIPVIKFILTKPVLAVIKKYRR